MARFFADEIHGDTAILIEDAAHIGRILRMQAGDALTVYDGTGMQYDGHITSLERDGVRVSLKNARPADTEPDLQVTVYQGICKGARFETATQKCVELGAVRIVPLHVAHCEIAARDMQKRLPRLQKIAREAAKQCGRGIVPQVAMPVSLADVCALPHELLLCPYEAARAQGLRRVAAQHPAVRRIGLVIGPEGGFAKAEIEALQRAGAQIVTLGPRILRTETAGPAALAALMALYGQWDGEED